MIKTQFFKVLALPSTLEPSSFYYVENGNFVDGYLTDGAGVAKPVGNVSMINSLLDDRISELNDIDIVADITERDALVLSTSQLVLVIDASADVSVTSGAALYIWDTEDNSFKLLVIYTDVNATISWANILNKPSSSTSDIDDSVSKKHSHSNSVELSKVGETGTGIMTYGGVPVFDPEGKLTSKRVDGTLPTTLEADTAYFVDIGGKFDLYVTNSSGTIVATSLNASSSSNVGSSITGRISSYEDQDYFIGYNKDSSWNIVRYDGDNIDLKTRATQLNNPSITELSNAWSNKLTLTYA